MEKLEIIVGSILILLLVLLLVFIIKSLRKTHHEPNKTCHHEAITDDNYKTVYCRKCLSKLK